MRMRKLAAGVLVGLVGMASAHANVIYNFEPDAGTGGSYPTGYGNVTFIKAIGGRLEVGDAAYHSGAVHVDYDGKSATDAGVPRVSVSLDISHRLGVSASSFPADNYIFDGSSYLFADLIFRDDGLIDGSLSFRQPTELVAAAGTGDRWIVDHFLSDFFTTDSPCAGGGDGCYAGTGRWVLDPSSLSVTEPAAWAFYAIAMLGMVAAVRRRRMG